MNTSSLDVSHYHWRIIIPLLIFLFALTGFELGVSVTERPDVAQQGLLAKAYYSISLFVVGGVDLGTPIGGPSYARALLWIAYFAAPIYTASALISAVISVLSPRGWSLRRLRNHIVIVGNSPMAYSYLRVLRQKNPKIPAILICPNPEGALAEHMRAVFAVKVVAGDIRQAAFFDLIGFDRAVRILLLEENSQASYEAAAIVLNHNPELADRIILHCTRLRYMRAMEQTSVAQRCYTFNAYQLAAAGMVRHRMLQHFQETSSKDVVVVAGFGRFGQSVLEELYKVAVEEMDTLIVIDVDADRRVLVADEQRSKEIRHRRIILQGDISHPDVWDQARRAADLEGENTLFVLGTGREEENLRTALFLRRKYPLSTIIVRSNEASEFALQVGHEHNLVNVSITELLEQNIPGNWLGVI